MKILLAGDDPLTVSILRSYICDLAETTDIATSRKAFRLMAVGGRYDILLSMFFEPFLNGEDFAHCIPQRSIASPAIFILSWSHSESKIMSLYESGIDQYMTLPCDMMRLRGRIVQYLKKNGI